MNSFQLLCPKCKTPLREDMLNREQLAPCPACAAPLQVQIFPALFRPLPMGRSGESLVLETESSCFFHPQKKAVVHCEGCGRFLCGLCDCELHGQHFCPQCLETGKKKGKIKSIENERTLYDSIALGLAVAHCCCFLYNLSYRASRPVCCHPLLESPAQYRPPHECPPRSGRDTGQPANHRLGSRHYHVYWFSWQMNQNTND